MTHPSCLHFIQIQDKNSTVLSTTGLPFRRRTFRVAERRRERDGLRIRQQTCFHHWQCWWDWFGQFHLSIDFKSSPYCWLTEIFLKVTAQKYLENGAKVSLQYHSSSETLKSVLEKYPQSTFLVQVNLMKLSVWVLRQF